jgi:hypothetical protein
VNENWQKNELKSLKVKIGNSRMNTHLVSYLSYDIANVLVEHLEGMRVGHDFADIEEGEGMILTIKDRGVLDEDGMILIDRIEPNI